MTAAAQDEEVLGEAKDVSEFQAEPPPNLGRFRVLLMSVLLPFKL